MQKIVKRVIAPTPKFFRVLRTVGLVLAAVGGTIVASPVVLPAVITTVGGYVAVAGGVLSAVSQFTMTDESVLDAQEDEFKTDGQ